MTSRLPPIRAAAEGPAAPAGRAPTAWLRTTWRAVFYEPDEIVAFEGTQDELRASLMTESQDRAEGILKDATDSFNRLQERVDGAERRATTLQGSSAIAASLTIPDGGPLRSIRRVFGRHMNGGEHVCAVGAPPSSKPVGAPRLQLGTRHEELPNEQTRVRVDPHLALGEVERRVGKSVPSLIDALFRAEQDAVPCDIWSLVQELAEHPLFVSYGDEVSHAFWEGLMHFRVDAQRRQICRPSHRGRTIPVAVREASDQTRWPYGFSLRSWNQRLGRVAKPRKRAPRT